MSSLSDDRRVEETSLTAWARRRRIKHLGWLGVILALAAAAGVANAVDARARASSCTIAIAVLLLVGVTLAVAFQRCPRCRGTWNMRSLFGWSQPYSSSCLRCGLDAPSAGPFQPALLAIVLVPPLLTSALVVALHALLPAPAHHRDVSVTDISRWRGTSDFVSFRDGVARSDLLGSYVNVRPRRSRHGTGTHAVYQVVPFVPAEWTTSDPVRVWLLCADGPRTGDCIDPSRFLAALEEESRSGRPLQNAHIVPHGDVRNEDTGWYLATANAADRHGIRSAPDAIFVAWPADPERQ